LHGTLNHIMVADLIWMRRLTGAGDHPSNLNASEGHMGRQRQRELESDLYLCRERCRRRRL
jgi:uncharacterized damage-inducible protein DinB